VLEGVFSEDEKRALVRELAMAFGRAAGPDMQIQTSVRIHEVKCGHRGAVPNLSGPPRRRGG
jgi:hypothetical protein